MIWLYYWVIGQLKQWIAAIGAFSACFLLNHAPELELRRVESTLLMFLFISEKVILLHTHTHTHVPYFKPILRHITSSVVNVMCVAGWNVALCPVVVVERAGRRVGRDRRVRRGGHRRLPHPGIGERLTRPRQARRQNDPPAFGSAAFLAQIPMCRSNPLLA